MPREYLFQKMCLKTAVLTIPECPVSPPEADNATGDEDTKGPDHPGILCLPQTMVLRVTEVHCQWLLQCHPDQIAQTGQGIPDKVDNVEKKLT